MQTNVPNQGLLRTSALKCSTEMTWVPDIELAG